MEPRKVQRVGTSTLAVSLPSDWVKTSGIKRGDLIYFHFNEENTLTLITSNNLPETPTEASEVYVDLCADPTMLSKIIVANYILGRDIIKVISSDRLNSDYVDSIRQTVQRLIGIAIMEETPNQVILQSSIDISQFPINTLIRRLFIIASTMYQETMDSLIKSNIRLAQDTVQRRGEANMMFNVIIRLLDSAQRDKVTAEAIRIPESMNIIWFRVVIQCLWLIANWSEKIAQKTIALTTNRHIIGERLLIELQEIGEKAYSIVHRAMNSLFSNNIMLANKTIADYQILQQEEETLQERICSHAYLQRKSFSVSKFFKGTQPIEPCIIAQISFILWSIRRIAELGSEISEVAITKAVSKPTKVCNILKINDNVPDV
jgi:phosphate uptake regulator